jgi:uncharacterized protein
MRALLDVNVLIALLDADHVLHEPAIAWFSANAAHGWASCPITQNGCLRVMSSPGYPGRQPMQVIVDRLTSATAHAVHEFWPGQLSLLEEGVVDLGRVHGPRQITDLYLLALAVRRGGRLVTFDRAIDLAAVRGAQPHHLLRL